MQITPFGAAGDVTGSAYLVETGRARVLVDFGMFQGRTLTGATNIVPPALASVRLDAVVLTHAHLDHTGRLPLLAQRGYRGPIYGTPATLDLSRLILDDAARLQAQDAERANRHQGTPRSAPRDAQGVAAATNPAMAQPLFDANDVAAVAELFRPITYEKLQLIAPGVEVIAHDAGHLLGSASLELRLSGDGPRRTVIFSGDLGPQHAAILRDPAELDGRADLVVLESTYGDRDHRPIAETVQEFRQLVRDAAMHGGKILVPTFAVGRAQALLYHLASAFEDGTVAPFPIYLDSPMAIEATRLYAKYPELFDDESRALADRQRFFRHLESVKYCVSAEDSKRLNAVSGPCLIMAGAGMCNAGRIVHHLRHNLARRGTVVLIVGYQAPGSLGRQLLEGARDVEIFGDRIPVHATVRGLGGFSAHAGQSELLAWFSHLAAHRPQVALTHGEDATGRRALAAKILERFGLHAKLPALGEAMALG